MAPWIPLIPTIISACVQLIKLLIELAEKKNSDEVKQCSIAIEDARKRGDTAKLEELIKKMREGKSCD